MEKNSKQQKFFHTIFARLKKQQQQKFSPQYLQFFESEELSCTA